MISRHKNTQYTIICTQKTNSHIHIYIGLSTFFYKTKIYKNNKLKLVKNNNKLRAF